MTIRKAWVIATLFEPIPLSETRYRADRFVGVFRLSVIPLRDKVAGGVKLVRKLVLTIEREAGDGLRAAVQVKTLINCCFG